MLRFGGTFCTIHSISIQIRAHENNTFLIISVECLGTIYLQTFHTKTSLNRDHLEIENESFGIEAEEILLPVGERVSPEFYRLDKL